MALDDYRRKRDFTRSPEPSGEKGPRRSNARARMFSVQKHLASHLHYDLRLEHNGVLMSWAVPKGPSLDPKTKRLAMHVEDHPIEYGDFEGVIPEGYGAGIVMLWDTGTWTPEVEDVDAALAKGDLKFTLDGYKLKGSWVLVRTRGYGGNRGDGRSWLLIKHRDDWSGDLDITEFAPRSVKSDQDFHEILAADNPDVWRSNRPVAGGETGALLKQIIEKAAALKSTKSSGGSKVQGSEGPKVRGAEGLPRRSGEAAKAGSKVRGLARRSREARRRVRRSEGLKRSKARSRRDSKDKDKD